MGITIDYESLAPVDQATKTRIDEDCEIIGISFDWWNEPMHFYHELNEDGRLEGFTKIVLIRYTDENGIHREIDNKDNDFMIWTDAYQIVTYLLRWAKLFNISWRLDFYGDDMGIINPEGVSPELDKYMTDWAKSCGVDIGDWIAVVIRRRLISARYAYRNR